VRYFLYIAGFDGKTEQVGLAFSTDQKNWQVSPAPILPIGAPGSWDAVQTSNPSVLYEDGLFRMWYQGVDARHTYRIGYAESEDGWNWQKKPKVMFQRPGLDHLADVPRREGYHQPLVLPDGERYLMYFNDHRGGVGHIRVAISEDKGYTWQVVADDCLQPEKKWEGRGLHYPWVIRQKAGYTMWYTSEDYKHHWYLSRAVSADGIVWQREPATRPVIGKETTRRFSLGHYWMPRQLLKFYPNYRHPKIRAAYPEKFQKAAGNRALAFYDRVVFPFRRKRYMSFNNSSVIQQPDGEYLMYFQSRDENEILSVGRARSKDGIHWEKAETNILSDITQGYDWCSVFDADPHLLIVE